MASNKISILCKAIEASTGIKLMADTDTDAVDGYINQSGDTIEIFMYDKDESPNQEHKSTLKKRIPTQIEIEKINTEIDKI